MISALLLAAALAAQQAEPPSPAPVCLTNACGPEPKLTADPAAVRAAIVAGEPLKVVELGGTADEVMDAGRERQKRMRLPGQTYNPALGFDRFADASDGSTYVLKAPAEISTPPGITVVRTVERRYPDGGTELMHLLSNGSSLNQVRRPQP